MISGRALLTMHIHLPNHSASVPVLGLGLLQAAGERSGVHKAVGCILGNRGLADDEIVGRDSGCDNLEDGRLWPCARRLGEESLAGRVFHSALCRRH